MFSIAWRILLFRSWVRPYDECLAHAAFLVSVDKESRRETLGTQSAIPDSALISFDSNVNASSQI